MQVWRFRATIIAMLAVLLTVDAVMAEPSGSQALLSHREVEHFERLVRERGDVQQQEFLARLLSATRLLPRRRKRRSIDLTPLANMAIAYLKESGVPIVEQRDKKNRPIAVSAQFSVAGDVPDVKLHLGDRPAEQLGAFYPSKKGFRFSVVYPMENLSLRLDGGDDSEFGSLAVAGLSWVHPSKRFAAGLGLPVRLKNADGNFGAIFQFRINLQ